MSSLPSCLDKTYVVPCRVGHPSAEWWSLVYSVLPWPLLSISQEVWVFKMGVVRSYLSSDPILALEYRVSQPTSPPLGRKVQVNIGLGLGVNLQPAPLHSPWHRLWLTFLNPLIKGMFYIFILISWKGRIQVSTSKMLLGCAILSHPLFIQSVILPFCKHLWSHWGVPDNFLGEYMSDVVPVFPCSTLSSREENI